MQWTSEKWKKKSWKQREKEAISLGCKMCLNSSDRFIRNQDGQNQATRHVLEAETERQF